MSNALKGFLALVILCICFQSARAYDRAELEKELQLARPLAYCEKVSSGHDPDIGTFEIADKLTVKESPKTGKVYAFFHSYGLGAMFFWIEVKEIKKTVSEDRQSTVVEITGMILDSVPGKDKSVKISMTLRNGSEPEKEGVGRLTSSFTKSVEMTCKSTL